MTRFRCEHRVAKPVLAALCLLLGMSSTWVAAAPAPAANSDAALIARGKYLANAGDCVACHSAVGGKPLAGGLSMMTPFGPLVSPNITPDKETGIGNWTDDDFYKLMHEGISKNGDYVYPVMPFPWYTIVSREDVLAIKAYLFSVPPVHKPNAPNTLTFPFNIRTSLVAWRAAFFKPGEFKPDPTQSTEVNRGAYLVNGLTHCGECHNANPVAGTSRWREPLAGGTVENWYAPNISSDVRDGIGAWSNADIATFLKTGTAPGKGIAVGPMAEAVHSLRNLTDADLASIAAYLKTTPAKAVTAKESAPAETYERGAQGYLNFCASCHGLNGEGQASMIPALKDNGAVTAAGPQNVISVMLGGLNAQGTYAPMLAIGAGMTDDEIADVANYVRKTWNNDAPASATPGMVAKVRTETDTLMNVSPLTNCPPIDNDRVAKAVASTGITRQLATLTDATMYKGTAPLVAKLKAATPGVSSADLVNGLAAAYCPVVRKDPALDANGKALRLGHFVQFAYMAATGANMKVTTAGMSKAAPLPKTAPGKTR